MDIKRETWTERDGETNRQRREHQQITRQRDREINRNTREAIDRQIE